MRNIIIGSILGWLIMAVSMAKANRGGNQNRNQSPCREPQSEKVPLAGQAVIGTFRGAFFQ